MRIAFSKWQGTGNDFVVIDDRLERFPTGDLDLVRRLCDRHFGIGSDGLILLRPSQEQGVAFHMEFFNPDGSQSFCGNGSRCAFAAWVGLAGATGTFAFTAIDGLHRGAMDEQGRGVRVEMRPAVQHERLGPGMDLLDTGSPHLLLWVDDPEKVDLIPEARSHRYGPSFREDGVNVNFLAWRDGCVHMRTYERGVEGETLSCGTGVTAAALSALQRGHAKDGTVEVHTRGGTLWVEHAPDGTHLIGPAQQVFEGHIPTGA
jgi:diaminopimelate epimerase